MLRMKKRVFVSTFIFSSSYFFSCCHSLCIEPSPFVRIVLYLLCFQMRSIRINCGHNVCCFHSHRKHTTELPWQTENKLRERIWEWKQARKRIKRTAKKRHRQQRRTSCHFSQAFTSFTKWSRFRIIYLNARTHTHIQISKTFAIHYCVCRFFVYEFAFISKLFVLSICLPLLSQRLSSFYIRF